jgi:hypothetical protein
MRVINLVLNLLSHMTQSKMLQAEIVIVLHLKFTIITKTRML